MEDLKILTESVCCIAREAGYFLKEERKNFSREAVQKKQAHDYVSYVDKESEKRVVAALRELLPEAGFIAEEGSAVYHDEPYCWVVDPLDGTTNYIHDNAPYCVSIALRDKDSLLLGVVYDPCRDECFYAWQGGGAYVNGERMEVSSVQQVEDAFLDGHHIIATNGPLHPLFLKLAGEVIGNHTRIKVVKNKIAPPFKEAEFDIMFGKGISKEGDILDLAANVGIISKSGAWYAYEGDKIGQGRENAKTYLRENPEFCKMIEEMVREHYFAQEDETPEGEEETPVSADAESKNE